MLNVMKIPPSMEPPVLRLRSLKQKIYQRVIDNAKFDLLTALQDDMAGVLCRNISMAGGIALKDSLVARTTPLLVAGEVEVEVWCAGMYYRAIQQANDKPELVAPAPEETPQ